MEQVADHLYDFAIHNFSDESSKLFARSAFNRYYYYIYLLLRDEIDSVVNLSNNGFPHGHKAMRIIEKSYKKNITDRLTEYGDFTSVNMVETLISKIKIIYPYLYELREQSDYKNPTITLSSTDAIILYKDSNQKKQEYKLSAVKQDTISALRYIKQLSIYRIMAGYYSNVT